MPAVDLARLRIQSATVTDQFGSPEKLLRALHDMLDLYADRTRRPGRIASPVTVLPAYNVPAPAMRQLEADLGFQAELRPDETVRLADALWKDGYLETRLLAAYLLGCIPPHGDEFMDRLTDWVAETREPNVRRTLFSASLGRLRREDPGGFLRLMARWVHLSRHKMWNNAIQALMPLIQDPNFDNLPVVFELIRPMIEASVPSLQNDIAALLTGLYEASPAETTFFLRRMILLPAHPQMRVTLRRILQRLPEELQESLAEALRSAA